MSFFGSCEPIVRPCCQSCFCAACVDKASVIGISLRSPESQRSKAPCEPTFSPGCVFCLPTGFHRRQARSSKAGLDDGGDPTTTEREDFFPFVVTWSTRH